MTALDDLLASITLANLDDITAKLLGRITEVRKAAVTDDAALRDAIGTRVASLRSSAAVATTDQATASAAATTETAIAAAVTASAPALTLDYLKAVRDAVAQIHTTLAGLQTWRAQTDGGSALATTATADLATVVATKL
jgi:hypothetical protein